MNNITVELHDVHYSYGGGDVVRGVTAALDAGRLHALFGPNGSGKSTLLSCITGLLPAPGIRLCGQDAAALSVRRRSRLVAYVPQEHRLTFPFTAGEVVLMGRTPHLGGIGGPAAADRAAAQHALAAIGIDALAQHPYTRLSGGQRQLVLIARALAQDTPVIVLDEPTSALDFKNQMLVWQLLRRLADAGKTVIACTHDPNHLLWFCDHALVLERGRLIGDGDAAALVTGGMLERLYGGICRVENGAVRPCEPQPAPR